MPIYEYRCAACGHTLDALQKMADDPLKDCPACEKPSLKRLMSAPSFRLKGGGWYETDFKSDKEKKRNLVGGAEAASDGKSKSAESSTTAEAPKSADKPKAGDAPKKEKSPAPSGSSSTAAA